MTAVLGIRQEGNKFILTIIQEVCGKNEKGVDIPITQAQKDAIESLDWDRE